MPQASQDNKPLQNALSPFLSQILNFPKELFQKKRGFKPEASTQLSIFIYKLGRLVKFCVRLRMDCNVAPPLYCKTIHRTNQV